MIGTIIRKELLENILILRFSVASLRFVLNRFGYDGHAKLLLALM